MSQPSQSRRLPLVQPAGFKRSPERSLSDRGAANAARAPSSASFEACAARPAPRTGKLADTSNQGTIPNFAKKNAE